MQFKQKTNYDKHPRSRKFDDGDKVLLLFPAESNKLIQQWKGPHEMDKKVNRMNIRVDANGVVGAYYAYMLKQYVERQNWASHCLRFAEANATVGEET